MFVLWLVNKLRDDPEFKQADDKSARIGVWCIAEHHARFPAILFSVPTATNPGTFTGKDLCLPNQGCTKAGEHWQKTDEADKDDNAHGGRLEPHSKNLENAKGAGLGREVGYSRESR
ncbi:hypothetical protein SCUP515_12515 [Seiridium cupressi]